MQNLVKIGKELRTDLFTNTDEKTDYWVYPTHWINNKFIVA